MTLCPRCGALMREDLTFLAAMLSIQSDRQQWRCLNGHSVTVGAVPTLPRSRGLAPDKREALRRKNRLRWKLAHPLVGRRGADHRGHEIAMGGLGH